MAVFVRVKLKPSTRFAVNGLLVVLVTALLGCAGLWQSLKSSAAPAIGGAGGAAVGSLVGPAGTIAGAGIGAALGNGVEENASLRSGETVGDEALEKLWLRGAASAAVSETPWFLRMSTWAWAFAAYIAIRNADTIALVIKYLFKKDGPVGNLAMVLRGIGHVAVGPAVESPRRVLEREEAT